MGDPGSSGQMWSD